MALVATMRSDGRRRAFSTPPNVCGWTINNNNGSLVGVCAGGAMRTQLIVNQASWTRPFTRQNFRHESNLLVPKPFPLTKRELLLINFPFCIVVRTSSLLRIKKNKLGV